MLYLTEWLFLARKLFLQEIKNKVSERAVFEEEESTSGGGRVNESRTLLE